MAVDPPQHIDSMGHSISSQQYKSYFSKAGAAGVPIGGTVHHQTSKFVVDQNQEVVIMGQGNTERRSGIPSGADSKHQQEPLL